MTKDIKEILKVGFTVNIFEWYDFSIYASMANVIGEVFFSGMDKKILLIKAFLIFSISYLARPVGSIFFGYIADKYGRKISLKYSLLLMAIPTFFIGLLPEFKIAGLVSAGLLIFLRVIQGFAAGGELPVSSCYIYEVAPKDQKNLFCSFVASSSMFGVFLGSLSVFTLHIIFSDIQIREWAWRIPFLISGIFAIIIFQLRKSIRETKEFKYTNINNKKEFVKLILFNKIQIIQMFFLNGFISIAFYLLFVWMPAYLHAFIGLSPHLAYLSNSLGMLTLILLTLIIGYISRHFQRKNFLMIGIMFICIMVYPLFILLNQKIFLLSLIAQITFAIGLSFADGVIYATIGSMFDSKIRCSGISLGFTLPTAIFGGLSPTICSYLIYKTGSYLSPILFLTISGIAAFITAKSLR